MKIKFTKKHIFYFWPFLFIPLLWLPSYFNTKSDVNLIEQNLLETTGEISNYRNCFGKRRCVDYKYMHLDKMFTYSINLEPGVCANGSCIGKYYLVEYSAKDPSISRVIINDNIYYPLEGFCESMGLDKLF